MIAINDGPKWVNRCGLSRKHILDAVDKSIERLGTYIDVLQIHRLDRETSMREIMRALDDVVRSGKVRYIGASSMYAWEFQMMQNIAERNNWTKFISMQNYQNLLVCFVFCWCFYIYILTCVLVPRRGTRDESLLQGYWCRSLAMGEHSISITLKLQNL
jgi:hypothetical protein